MTEKELKRSPYWLRERNKKGYIVKKSKIKNKLTIVIKINFKFVALLINVVKMHRRKKLKRLPAKN